MAVPTTERYTTRSEMWTRLNTPKTGQARDDDAMLAAILTAEIAIDAWCDRRFDNESDTAARYFRPYRGSARYVEIDDVIDIASVECSNGTKSSGTFAAFAGDYITQTCQGGSIWRLEAETVGWGTWVKVTPTTSWGWSAVPEPIAEMARKVAARLYKGKDDTSGGIIGLEGGGGMKIPTGLDRNERLLLKPWRRVAGP